MAGKEFELGPTGRTVSENIKRLRAHRSFAELSRALSEIGRPIPPLGLRRIEAGDRRVDVDELLAFAFVFGVNPNAILFPRVQTDETHVPTGAPSTQDLSRVWAWADGFSPYDANDRESIDYFKLMARPNTGDEPEISSDSMELVVSQLDELMSRLGMIRSSIDGEREAENRGDD